MATWVEKPFFTPLMDVRCFFFDLSRPFATASSQLVKCFGVCSYNGFVRSYIIRQLIT